MNKLMHKKCIVPYLLALTLTLAACSDSGEDSGDTGRLQEKQQQIAEKTGEIIILPIEKAKSADALSADRNRRMREQLEEQTE